MSKHRNRLKNMEEANKRMLVEDHEKTNQGKIDYIKGALKNLKSEDLDKIYLSVEKYDPNYDSNHE